MFFNIFVAVVEEASLELEIEQICMYPINLSKANTPPNTMSYQSNQSARESPHLRDRLEFKVTLRIVLFSCRYLLTRAQLRLIVRGGPRCSSG
jgi:hypothetical protein